MSYSNVLKSFSIVAVSAIIGYSAVSFIQQASSPNRFIASMTMSKMASEQFSKTVFDVRVMNTDIGLTESDTSTVQVTVEAFKALPAGLPYSWNLPDDVLIIDGAQQGVFAAFNENQSQTITLKVKGYNKSKKSYLSFSVNGNLDSVKLHREVLLSSRPEDSFEYIVQQNEKQRQNDLKANNKTGRAISKSPIDLKNVVH